MAQALIAAMPPDLDLPDGYKVVWDAISPTTGASVSGVKVQNVSIFGTMLGVGGGTLQQANPILIGVNT